MKRKFKYGFMAMMLGMAMLSCNNSGGRYYESTDTGAAIEESQADNSAADDSAAAEEKLAELESMPELQNYKGLYKVTDENGKLFNIYFTKDNSVIITTGEGNVYYCSFNEFTNIDKGISIYPSEDSFNMGFKGGEESYGQYSILVLKDNWLYASKDYADSNNPNWRLPVTVVKAFGGKKSEYSSSSYKSSESSSYSKNRNSDKASDYDYSDEVDPRDEELAMRAASIYKDPTDAVYDNLRRKYRND